MEDSAVRIESAGRPTGVGASSIAGEPPRVGFRAGAEIVDLAAAGLGAVFAEPDGCTL